MAIVAKTIVNFGTKEKYETAFPHFDYTGFLIDNRFVESHFPGQLDQDAGIVVRFWHNRAAAEKYIEWTNATLASIPMDEVAVTIEDYTE